jgi:AraC-like DNA-binding protein
MGPMRYLWLRRMHLVRRTLLRATSGATTVTEVAMNFGFWELGRFSVAYRRLFGELPLTSLHRPPGELPGSDGNPFALPAAESA